MKVVLLTSNSLRHRYIARQLAEQLQLELVIAEEKSAGIQNTSRFSEADATFIAGHFNARTQSEWDFFGDFQNFPKEVPVVKIPHGTINVQKVNILVDSHHPDYLVLFGSSIIKDPLLEKYSGRIINLHLGLSPYYQGSATNLFPFYYNEPECVGATIHLATSKVDDGPVLHQLRPDIEWNDNLHSIGNKTILKAGKILPDIIKAFSTKKFIPNTQSGTGKICRNRDLTPILLREIYQKFESGIIKDYLKEKENRDRQHPIISMSRNSKQ